MEFIEILISLLTLTVLEVVLGIDNLVFLAIISNRLPQHQQKKARRFGLTLAWVTRLLLLFSAIWLTKLVHPFLTIFNFDLSGRDLFLMIGGLFLLTKATQEIHAELEPIKKEKNISVKFASFSMIVAQIAILDIVFSLDSVLTAIGLTDRFWLMAVAITFAIFTMIFLSEPLSRFIERHPTIKMLALSFLIMIGMVLVADGFHFHVPRGYVYVAMAFSLFVEVLNMTVRKRKR